VEELYDQRPSREEDVNRIAALELQLHENQAEFKRLIAEMRFYKLEMEKREQNYNKAPAPAAKAEPKAKATEPTTKEKSKPASKSAPAAPAAAAPKPKAAAAEHKAVQAPVAPTRGPPGVGGGVPGNSSWCRCD